VEAVMIRYSEIFLKSEPVKRRFISIMAENIRLALAAMNLPSVGDVENLKRKLDELEETIKRLEESVAKQQK